MPGRMIARLIEVTLFWKAPRGGVIVKLPPRWASKRQAPLQRGAPAASMTQRAGRGLASAWVVLRAIPATAAKTAVASATMNAARVRMGFIGGVLTAANSCPGIEPYSSFPRKRETRLGETPCIVGAPSPLEREADPQ